MPILENAVQAATSHLPKVIDPKTHAIIDYAVAGSFFLGTGLFWGKNKRAALAALIPGVAITTLALLTDYPGGVKKVISFETHGKVDTGLAGLVATLPNAFGFSDDAEARFFHIEALSESTVVGLTDWEAGTSNAQTRMRRAA